MRQQHKLYMLNKQWNNAFIVVLHFEVTMRPSTMSENSYLIVSSKRPLAPV